METVLLVDDTDLLQEIVGEGLQDLGYTVLVASTGEEALRVVSGHDGPVHVLLTDIIMPGMHGPELAARIIALHPEIRVLFMSGSGPHAASEPGVIEAGGKVIEKPFTLDQLANAVRDALAR